MHGILLAFFASVCLGTVVVDAVELRSLVNAYNMLKAATGNDSLSLKKYGNWCGKGGEGEPVDDFDKCCQAHDKCYYAVNRKECDSFLRIWVYLMPYSWDYVYGKVVCLSSNWKCSAATCECDRALASCFAGTTPNPKYEHEETLVSKVSAFVIGLFG